MHYNYWRRFWLLRRSQWEATSGAGAPGLDKQAESS
jgi:hypothetical protein